MSGGTTCVTPTRNRARGEETRPNGVPLGGVKKNNNNRKYDSKYPDCPEIELDPGVIPLII